MQLKKNYAPLCEATYCAYCDKEKTKHNDQDANENFADKTFAGNNRQYSHEQNQRQTADTHHIDRQIVFRGPSSPGGAAGTIVRTASRASRRMNKPAMGAVLEHPGSFGGGGRGRGHAEPVAPAEASMGGGSHESFCDTEQDMDKGAS